MNKQIEEQRKNIMLFIRDFVYKMRDNGLEFPEPRRVELEEWAKKIPNLSLTQFIDTEIDRLKSEIIEPTESDNGYMTGVTKKGVRLTHNQRIGYNQAIKDQITHLENIKKELV